MTDWQSIGAQLAQRLRFESGEPRATPLHGGDINQAFRLELGGREFFVKLNRAELLAMFDAELAGLEAIRRSGAIRVPAALVTGRAGDSAFIVMEYIELGGRPDMRRLAQALAALHGCINDRFGFSCDNTIGTTPQHNRFEHDWIEFWRRNRLGFQLKLAQDNGQAGKLIDAGHRLAERLDDFFPGYEPLPSLLHGDLWSGNQAADSDGNPVIFDPACYYGDHEADLAMMELFGNPGERFFSCYNEIFAIDSGYRLRRELYNLYHVLNHANLFGGGYAPQALRMTERMLAEVR